MKIYHLVLIIVFSFLAAFDLSAQSSLCVRKRLKVVNGKVNFSRAVSVAGEGKCARNSVEVGTGFQSGNVIYGDGSSGDLVVSEDTDLPAGVRLYSSIIIHGGATLTVPSGTVLRSQTTFVNNGTIDVRTYASGGSRLNYSDSASALGQRRAGAGLTPGGAAIGDWGDNSGVLKGAGGTAGFLTPYNTIVIFSPNGPLGGGGGAFGGTSTEGSFPTSAGGDGGGTLVVLSGGEIVNNGVINALGTDGGGPGAGGGGGGVVTLASGNFITHTGTVDVSGGDGAEGGVNAGAGGGGGGGLINFVAPVVTNSGTTIISGGVGGSEVPAGSVSASPRIGGGAGGGSAGFGGEGASVFADGSTGFAFSIPDGGEGRFSTYTADPKYVLR